MRTILTNGKIITPFKILDDQALIIEDKTISGIIPAHDVRTENEDQVMDVGGNWIAPGYIDIHVHGGNRADTMDANQEAFDRICRFFAGHGVTSFLFTTGTASNEAIWAVIEAYQDYQPPEDGAVPLGIHLEGPYLSEEKKGAQPAAFLRNPEPEEYRQWFDTGVVKLMTIAPELPGALKCVQYGKERGVEFAVGHSVATYQQMQDAVDAGLNQATHTFNGMKPLHHREPGVVGAVLADPRIYAQIITDGVHVHPPVVKALVNAKRKERTVLITDAIRAAGLGEGEYDLLGQKVTVADGEARIASGSLAGSILTMDEAVRNTMAFCELPLEDAVFMAAYAPAESIHVQDQRGHLQPGASADVVILSEDYTLESTFVEGRLVYQK